MPSVQTCTVPTPEAEPGLQSPPRVDGVVPPSCRPAFLSTACVLLCALPSLSRPSAPACCRRVSICSRRPAHPWPPSRLLSAQLKWTWSKGLWWSNGRTALAAALSPFLPKLGPTLDLCLGLCPGRSPPRTCIMRLLQLRGLGALTGLQGRTPPGPTLPLFALS